MQNRLEHNHRRWRSITFYRANTDIELDYWDGDTATLMNAEGNLIDSMTYPGEDSCGIRCTSSLKMVVYGKQIQILQRGKAHALPNQTILKNPTF